MTLDILRMQRRLQDVGIPQDQAEVFAEEIAHILASQVASKADLQEFRNEMLGKFTEVDGRFIEVDGRFAEMLVKFAEVDGRFAEMLVKFAEVDGKIAEVRNELADLKSGFAKWIVGLAVAMLLGFAGMSVAMVLSVFRLAAALG